MSAPQWLYYVDGGILGRRNPSPKGVYWSCWRRDGDGIESFIHRRTRNREYHTNQDAEWLAVLSALTDAVESGARDVLIRSDSRFVCMQFSGRWRTKIERHARLRYRCLGLAEQLDHVLVLWIPRRYIAARLGH